MVTEYLSDVSDKPNGSYQENHLPSRKVSPPFGQYLEAQHYKQLA